MKYALGNMLNGAGGLNADQLALDLQFAADKTLTARKGPTPVLTRGSAATQVGSTGLIEYAPENLLFPSELLTNSPTAVVLNRVTGDSVFSNPVFISETTSGTLHRVFTNVAVASSGVNSIGQFFFKQNGRQFIYFNGSNGAPSNTFNLSTGVFTNATGWTSQSLGEGWWKIITPVFQPSSNNPFWAFQLNTTNAVADSNYTGDTTKGVLFAGTQLERFSTARAYNPTTTAAFYGPRFDHDPVSPFACRGLLIEESRTNLVFPSDTLTTQTRTVTATAHTLSFYGTGTVALSGTHIATVVGTGAYPTRTTLTFTPTAGSLTLTVTGSVTQAQLEAGSFATSYIPTTTASVVRSADVCSITGASFTNMWNASEGTMFASGITRGYLAMANSGVNANQIAIFRNPSPLYMRFDVASGGAYTAQIAGPTIAEVSFNKTVGSYASNNARAAFNGTLGTPDTTVTVPLNLTALNIGSGSAGVENHNGTIAAIRYFRKPLSNAKLQALTV